MKKNNIIIVGIFCLCCVSCKEKKVVKDEKKKFSLSDTMLKLINIDTVQRCFVNDAITLSGEICFNENNVSKIFPRSGGLVLESKVTLGDRIKKGQVLAVIKSADVAGGYSDLAAAKADLVIAKKAFENISGLYKSGIASEKELTESKQNLEKAKLTVSKIESILQINGGTNSSSAGTYNLVAPTDGYLVEKKINSGNFIRPDMGDYLFTISDLKDIWVNANVFESDIPKVKEGYVAKITTLAYPNKIFEGRVNKVSEVLDPANKAMKIRINLHNEDGLLKPQMFAKISITNEESSTSLCVPDKAILNLDGKSYLVIYHSNNDLNVAEVEVLKTVGNKTYLNSGVKEGDKIITENQLLIFQQLLDM